MRSGETSLPYRSREVALDLAHRPATRVEAQNLIVETVEMRLALGDQARLETAGPVAWVGYIDLAILGQDRLRACAVAPVARAKASRIALLKTHRLSQLCAGRQLD